MARALLLSAFFLFLGGPAVVLLAGSFATGALVFSADVALFGVWSLVENRDRAVGWALVAVGTLTAAADLARLLLVGGSG